MDEKTQTLLTTIAQNEQKVYDAGKKTGENDFINRLFAHNLTAGNRFRFLGSDFTGYTFEPVLKPLSIGYMFYHYGGEELPNGIDFSEAKYDLNNADDYTIPVSVFYGARKLKEIPNMNIPSSKRMVNFARDCSALEKIELINSDETTVYTNAFSSDKVLTYIRFNGVIGQSISFSYSPLSVNSVKNIIEHLKDYSGVTNDAGETLEYAYTLTLKASCVTELETAEFTEEDKVWLAEKGITYSEDLTWATVIDNFKWNLVSA